MMFRRTLCAGVALACWVTAAGVNPARGQTPPPPREERQEQRQERRDERRGTEQVPATQVPVPVQGQPTQVQQRTDVQPGDARQDARQPQTYKVKDVLGTRVSIQGNLAIGTVDDIIFDDDGYIDYLVVLNEGKYVVVPWQAAKFNFAQKTATVNITQQQFQQIPTYTAQQWPTVNFYAPAFREQINRYWGPLLPGRERRSERRENRRGP